jgi:hypothetical protein
MTYLRPWAICPTCHAPLDGGPVVWWCGAGHGQVHDATLDPSVVTA